MVRSAVPAHDGTQPCPCASCSRLPSQPAAALNDGVGDSRACSKEAADTAPYKLTIEGLAVSLFFAHHLLHVGKDALNGEHAGQLWFMGMPRYSGRGYLDYPATFRKIATWLKSSHFAPTDVTELAALQKS